MGPCSLFATIAALQLALVPSPSASGATERRGPANTATTDTPRAKPTGKIKTRGKGKGRLKGKGSPAPVGAAGAPAAEDPQKTLPLPDGPATSSSPATPGSSGAPGAPTTPATPAGPASAAPAAPAGSAASGTSMPAKPGKPPPEPRPLPKTYLAVAVLSVRGSDTDFDLLHEIEQALLNEVDEMRGMRAITPGDVLADTVAANLSPERCNADLACLARSGRHAGAHMVLDSRVASLGGVLSIASRIIDTERGLELGRVAQSLSDDAGQRAAELHRLAVQLFLPDTFVGTLRVKCAQKDADVYVDDKLVGTTPLTDSIEALRAGPHILRVSKPGFADLYQFVDVVYDRASTIEVDLSTTTVVGIMVEKESATGVGELFIATDEAGLEIRVDGEPRGTTPLSRPLAGVAAGKRRVSLRKEGIEPFASQVVVVAGKRADLVVTRAGTTLAAARLDVRESAVPLPSPHDVGPTAASATGGDSTAVSREPTWRTYGGLTAAGAGALGTLTGIVFAWRVASINNEARSRVAHLQSTGAGTYSCSELSRQSCQDTRAKLHSLAADGDRAQTIEAIGFIAGGSLLAAGGVLYAWDFVRRDGWPSWVPLLGERTTATLLVLPTSGGAAAQLAVEF